MSAIQDLTDAVTMLQAENSAVISLIAGLDAKVEALMATLANTTDSDGAIEEAANAVKAEVDKLKAAVAAVPPGDVAVQESVAETPVEPPTAEVPPAASTTPAVDETVTLTDNDSQAQQ